MVADLQVFKKGVLKKERARFMDSVIRDTPEWKKLDHLLDTEGLKTDQDIRIPIAHSTMQKLQADMDKPLDNFKSLVRRSLENRNLQFEHVGQNKKDGELGLACIYIFGGKPKPKRKKAKSTRRSAIVARDASPGRPPASPTSTTASQ